MKTDPAGRFPSAVFLVALALLAAATGAVVFEVYRGLDLSAGFVRRPSRPSPSASATDDQRPPMAITIDGVSVQDEPLQAAGSTRLMARTISLSLSTDRYHDIRDAIDQLVATHHGALVGVVATTAATSAGASSRSLTATMTVPLVEAVAARVAARTLGTVLQETPSTEDLTDADRALLARIQAARAEDRRLTALLAGGTAGIPDVAGVQRAQSRARTEADRLTLEETALAARAAVVTIVLKIEGR
jgi:hypothetical protein